jgi:hypothetical protein
MNKRKCQALNKYGEQCTRSSGHKGYHRRYLTSCVSEWPNSEIMENKQSSNSQDTVDHSGA